MFKCLKVSKDIDGHAALFNPLVQAVSNVILIVKIYLFYFRADRLITKLELEGFLELSYE
jgi:hypothetical protein